MAPREPVGVGFRHIEKAFTKRFVLGVLKSRKFPGIVMSRASGRCPWDVFIDIPVARSLCMGGERGSYIKLISVGSALPVRLYRAMREPQDVERATGTDLHAFLYAFGYRNIHAAAGRSGGRKAERLVNMEKVYH